jgi:hypothetical protein
MMSGERISYKFVLELRQETMTTSIFEGLLYSENNLIPQQWTGGGYNVVVYCFR